jgi:AAA+ ATPase superfamily predicted ATPase
MMQGLVLAGTAPLYGRAREVLDLSPIDAVHLPEALPTASVRETVELYTAWGGVPRYWELAAAAGRGVAAQVERLVLDPLGPLHREPDRLLLEEIPSALEVRPVLDAIGAGAHRVSEIAARLGRPATSMARPLERLIGMGLVRREVPFGEPARASRRSLYKIADPFFRLWFRVVAPHRGPLASAARAERLRLLARFWDELAAQAWEDVCRLRLPRLGAAHALGRLGPWTTPARWWSGAGPEWDLVCESLDGSRLLLGEAKWSPRPFGRKALDRARAELAAKPPPAHPAPRPGQEVLRALFVPEVERGVPAAGGGLVTGRHLLPPRRSRRAG